MESQKQPDEGNEDADSNENPATDDAAEVDEPLDLVVRRAEPAQTRSTC